MDIKDYVTVKEAAQLMKVSKQEIHRRIYMGKIKAVKFGKMFFIPRTELQNFIAPATHSNIRITFFSNQVVNPLPLPPQKSN